MRAYTNGLSISTNNNQPEKSEMLTVMQFQAVLLVYHCLFVFWNHVTYFIRIHNSRSDAVLSIFSCSVLRYRRFQQLLWENLNLQSNSTGWEQFRYTHTISFSLSLSVCLSLFLFPFSFRISLYLFFTMCILFSIALDVSLYISMCIYIYAHTMYNIYISISISIEEI